MAEVTVGYWSPKTERYSTGDVSVLNLEVSCSSCGWSKRGATHFNARSLAKGHVRRGCAEEMPDRSDTVENDQSEGVD